MKAHCQHCLYIIDPDLEHLTQCPACHWNPVVWINGEPPNTEPEITTLYQIGSEVLLGEEIKATVIGIEIKHSFRIRYNVSWWDEREYKDLWMYDFEIKPTSRTKIMAATFQER